MNDDHVHVDAKGVRTEHTSLQCPTTEYKGRRNILGRMAPKGVLLDEFTDKQGKVHYRRPGS